MGLLGIIWMALIGLVIGGLAKFFMPGRDPGGIIITILLGVAGSFVAGYLGQAVGWYRYGQVPGLIASVLGAILILVIYRIIVGNRSVTS